MSKMQMTSRRLRPRRIAKLWLQSAWPTRAGRDVRRRVRKLAGAVNAQQARWEFRPRELLLRRRPLRRRQELIMGHDAGR